MRVKEFFNGLLAEQARPVEPTLFETRPYDLVPMEGKLRECILRHTRHPVTRREVTVRIVKDVFGQFKQTQIRDEICALIKGGQIATATGKSRIKDDVRIWRT